MENDSQKKLKYKKKSNYSSQNYKYIDSKVKQDEDYTSQNLEQYEKRRSLKEIDNKIKHITIKYKDKEYDIEKLNKIYNELAEINQKQINNIPKIYVSEELNEISRKELINWKTQMAASSWKSTQRSLRKKGKLDQYKIDALNKLGMVWNPKEDEWEKNYLKFRTVGFCDELEVWVKDQRILFNNNEISNENLLRLKAIKFPFEPIANEEYPFTRKSVWGVIEKLQKKRRRLEIKKEKILGVYSSKKKTKLTKKEKKEKDSQKEVNSFYRRKFQYCSGDFIFELNEKDALNKIYQIDKGISIYKGRLKNFLDSESNKYKSEGRKTPSWVSKFYTEVIDSESKLTPNEKYNELSSFNTSKFNSVIRTKACEYMLSYISNRNINNSRSFKEIKYLIGAYNKEKNRGKLLALKKLIKKYPLLLELYENKIDVILNKF